MNTDFFYYFFNSLTSNQIVIAFILLFIFLFIIFSLLQGNARLNAITFIPKKNSDQKFIIKETIDKTFTLQIKRVFFGISYFTYFHGSKEGICDSDDFYIHCFKTKHEAEQKKTYLSKMASYEGDRIVGVY
jgi:hypothetical protein